MQSLFRTSPPDAASLVGPVVALRARLEQDKAAADRAQEACDRFALVAVDDPKQQPAADRAYGALVDAIQQHERTERTLAAAVARTEVQRKQQAHAALDAQLTRCVTLADKRAKAAGDVQKAVKHLADAVDAQRQAELALTLELPANFSTARRDGLYLENEELRASVFHEIQRVQMWPGPLPMKEHGPYAEKYQQSVSVMQQRRLEVLGESAP